MLVKFCRNENHKAGTHFYAHDNRSFTSTKPFAPRFQFRNAAFPLRCESAYLIWYGMMNIKSHQVLKPNGRAMPRRQYFPALLSEWSLERICNIILSVRLCLRVCLSCKRLCFYYTFIVLIGSLCNFGKSQIQWICNMCFNKYAQQTVTLIGHHHKCSKCARLINDYTHKSVKRRRVKRCCRCVTHHIFRLFCVLAAAFATVCACSVSMGFSAPFARFLRGYFSPLSDRLYCRFTGRWGKHVRTVVHHGEGGKSNTRNYFTALPALIGLSAIVRPMCLSRTKSVRFQKIDWGLCGSNLIFIQYNI